MECARKCFKLDIQESALRVERGVRLDVILEWNGVGGDGMLPPLFPAKRVA